jgi:hypothetical protein
VRPIVRLLTACSIFDVRRRGQLVYDRKTRTNENSRMTLTTHRASSAAVYRSTNLPILSARRNVGLSPSATPRCVGNPQLCAMSPLTPTCIPLPPTRLWAISYGSIILLHGVQNNVTGSDVNQQPMISLGLEPPDAKSFRLIRIFRNRYLRAIQRQ